MITCNVCLEDKPEEEFTFRDKKNGKRQRYCKLCDSVRRKSAYRNHKTAAVQKQVERNKQFRREFQDLKATLACQVCGEDAPECLDFHHTDPNEKDFTISEAVRRGPKFWNELKKCVVLCSNCHRKVHSGRIECPRMPPVFETGES